MNDFRLKLYQQITNQVTGGSTSIFNKVSGLTILISIVLSVLSTENQIDYMLGEQIDLIDWIFGCLFSIE